MRAGTEENPANFDNFEVIKSVERLINFTDNTSDGTNRMSASHAKFKISKMSGEKQPMQVQETPLALNVSSVTFEDNTRRSVEIKNLRQNNNANCSEIRAKTQSKSIDSAGNVSNLHDIMMKPKGIEVHSMSMGTSSNVGTPHNYTNSQG